MAPMKLYGMYMSTCSRRVLTTLEEKGVPVEDIELVPVNLLAREHKKPEFLEKQPFGVIPVLEDGDIQIFESRAIARYLAEKYAGQGTDLLGSTPKERALIGQWWEVESQNYNPAVSGLVAEALFKPMFVRGEPDKAKCEELAKKAGAVLDIYEKHLATNDYLAGDKFSIADVSHLPYTFLLAPAGYGDLITSRPNVSKWWDRISSRPSWAKVSKLQ